MNRNNLFRVSYKDDDHSRFSGPEYLDRVSLSRGVHNLKESGAGHGKGPKGYQRPDGRIYEDICEALLNDPIIDATDIEIEVHDGIVTLRGTIDGRAMKKEVETCTEHIPGVKDVFNMINLHEFSDAGGKGLVKNQARIQP
jgi:hypothetical protein